jgi:uncharacterized membrane protein
VISKKVFGRFTPKGYEIYQKSINYRKFMTDMTLLKDYPPASLIIWEQHLVYATIFGVADKVIKHMKVVVKDSTVRSSNMYPLYQVSIMSSLMHSHSTAQSTVHSHSSGGSFGGGGGIGGGFGGGGGGAR